MNARGAVAVEFALVGALCVLCVLGIAELSALFLARAAIESAMTDGPRLADIDESTRASFLLGQAQGAAGNMLDVSHFTISKTTFGGTAGDAGTVEVYRVNYAWRVLTPILLPMADGNGNLTITATSMTRNRTP